MAKYNFWHKLRTTVLKRKIPFTTFSWRFFIPQKTLGVKLHRYVLFNMFKQYPTSLKFVAVTYNLARWGLYFAWVSIFKVYKAKSAYCLKTYDVPRQKQLTDLFYAAFACCIEPDEYYQTCLHQWPKKTWLDFAYDFQARRWHEAFAYKNSFEQQQLVNDKAEFEEFLNANDFPTINSLKIIEAEITQDELDSLPQKSFFKPAIGNRGAGCFTVIKDDSVQHERNLKFVSFKNLTETPFNNLEDLNRTIGKRKYLIQPVVENHPKIVELVKSRIITTIRIISGNIKHQTKTVEATLEAVIPENPRYYWNVVIETNTGKFIKPASKILATNESFNQWFSRLENQQFPEWEALENLCLKAHARLPELLTVGWDVALTESGPIIIEGNTSWGLRQQQILTNTPLTSGRLGKIYEDFINLRLK